MWVTLKCGVWCLNRSPTHKDDFVNMWKDQIYILRKPKLEFPNLFNDELCEIQQKQHWLIQGILLKIYYKFMIWLKNFNLDFEKI